ncbi:hypothetical protein [Acetobacter orientalis]|uniref:Uncharacterized protein n=2 Tax=Acetobacter orientalis TaxID=146474 RepID=A0A252A019_9PROT|nr:hypothetical protein [Acetobacter orientalis]OUI80390.1 hypothetical protein HK12_08920 [Acetobacter orientalis]
MKQENEENTPASGGIKGTTLFQSNAVLSTDALAWRGASDTRIPLVFVTPQTLPLSAARTQSAALFINTAPVPAMAQGWLAVKEWHTPTQSVAHAPACVCCVNPAGVGRVLASLAQERARGVCEFFTNLYVVCAAPLMEDVRKTLEKDNISNSLYGIKNKKNNLLCY